ncbi:MAG: PASTA domain-containing protein, partial [Bacteroidetes bacterium]
LATSIPVYEIRWDSRADGLSDKIFKKEVDSLAVALSGLFQDRSKFEYKKMLVKARNSGNRYLLIKSNVSYTQLKQVKKFPIFRNGRYKGGLIIVQKNIRKKPFKILASRTIGYDKDYSKPVGLEGAYRSFLRGNDGKQLMKKIAGGIWMPLDDKEAIDPEDGYDIVSTIDVDMQDVAEQSLLKQLEKHEADHGTVVLMEVATGEVKAIANLTRKGDKYVESFNYAIGESTEPGSTFKLMSLIAAMEDGLVDITDSVDTENGTTRFYDRIMRDSHIGGYGKISVKRAFEVSSNVGVSKVIYRSYGKNPQAFIDRLYKMNLHKKLGVEIAGEAQPKIKNTRDKGWSGVTLPWMSIGYEVRLTPLQILTFYNAIANNGKMVKPKFVKEIRRRGETVKKIETDVINPSVCSQTTLQKARLMLEGVVENGTARNLKNPLYKIAGKTGTAQIAAKTGYKSGDKVKYQASFVGYFPAENPKYSCIVVVNSPSKDVYYGNLVAGPIFKEIADKVYYRSFDLHKDISQVPLAEKKSLPPAKDGNKHDLIKIYETLHVPYENKNTSTEWAVVVTGVDSAEVLPRKIKPGLMPNVVGMGAEDAVYILENLGCIVEMEGKGTVKKQSVLPGTKIKLHQKVKIELS